MWLMRNLESFLIIIDNDSLYFVSLKRVNLLTEVSSASLHSLLSIAKYFTMWYELTWDPPSRAGVYLSAMKFVSVELVTGSRPNTTLYVPVTSPAKLAYILDADPLLTSLCFKLPSCVSCLCAKELLLYMNCIIHRLATSIAKQISLQLNHKFPTSPKRNSRLGKCEYTKLCIITVNCLSNGNYIWGMMTNMYLIGEVILKNQ